MTIAISLTESDFSDRTVFKSLADRVGGKVDALVDGNQDIWTSTPYYTVNIVDFINHDTLSQIGEVMNRYESLENKHLMETKAMESVNGPAHYKAEGGLEAIDVIETFNLGFNLGNVIKYILRAGKKDPKKHLEDLQKAKWYLEREINTLKGPSITIG
jgi:hypothetical protein